MPLRTKGNTHTFTKWKDFLIKTTQVNFINIINYYDTWEAGMKGNNYFCIVFYTFYKDLLSVPSVVDNHSSISHIFAQVGHGNNSSNQPTISNSVALPNNWIFSCFDG